jgi:hypothetical protein
MLNLGGLLPAPTQAGAAPRKPGTALMTRKQCSVKHLLQISHRKNTRQFLPFQRQKSASYIHKTPALKHPGMPPQSLHSFQNVINDTVSYT